MAIMWVNQGVGDNNLDGFNIYEANRDTARAIVQRAIGDWNAVIQDFNYAEDSDADLNNNLNDVFNLTISAFNLGNNNRGQVPLSSFIFSNNGSPRTATVQMDDNAVGTGWFFDTTPNDDAEFTALVNSESSGTGAAFQASFLNVNTGSFGYNDFYRTVVHEIGHALGITSAGGAAINTSPNMKQVFRASDGQAISGLRMYDGMNVDAMIVDGHLYQGPSGTPIQV
jgi:hypothetical protein